MIPYEDPPNKADAVAMALYGVGTTGVGGSVVDF
jgi:hypothetical protein